MHAVRVVPLAICLGAALLAGCAGSPAARLNSPPHGPAVETVDMQGTFVYMNDNALLADMTVCDYHFIPHRALLNTTGQERVHRLAMLMQAYGGEIRFNSDLTDETLLTARIKTVRELLAEQGVDTTREVIHRDLPGGEGMNADEAILIKKQEGTYNPKKASNSGTGGGTATGTGKSDKP